MTLRHRLRGVGGGQGIQCPSRRCRRRFWRFKFGPNFGPNLKSSQLLPMLMLGKLNGGFW